MSWTVPPSCRQANSVALGCGDPPHTACTQDAEGNQNQNLVTARSLFVICLHGCRSPIDVERHGSGVGMTILRLLLLLLVALLLAAGASAASALLWLRLRLAILRLLLLLLLVALLLKKIKQQDKTNRNNKK